MSDDIEHELDRQSRASRRRVRALLLDEGRPDLAAELDAKMKEIDSGLVGARSTWDALSEPQRGVLRNFRQHGGFAWRDPLHPMRFYHRFENGITVRYRAATVENLSRRNLVDWTVGASASGTQVRLSERGAFVLTHCDA